MNGRNETIEELMTKSCTKLKKGKKPGWKGAKTEKMENPSHLRTLQKNLGLSKRGLPECAVG